MMRYWGWILPCAHLAFAVGLFFYAPHQYRTAVLLTGGNSAQFHDEHWPAPAERVSRAINFPALAAMTPFNFLDVPNTRIYVFDVDGGKFAVHLWDLGYFALVFLLWSFIGTRIDRFREPRRSKTTSLLKLGYFVAFAASVLMGALAFFMFRSFHPDQEIAPFGIAWSLISLSYFVHKIADRA